MHINKSYCYYAINIMWTALCLNQLAHLIDFVCFQKVKIYFLHNAEHTLHTPIQIILSPILGVKMYATGRYLPKKDTHFVEGVFLVVYYSIQTKQPVAIRNWQKPKSQWSAVVPGFPENLQFQKITISRFVSGFIGEDNWGSRNRNSVQSRLQMKRLFTMTSS